MQFSSNNSPRLRVQPDSPEASTSAKQILVVEDDPSVRKLLQLSLAHAGYDVVTAEDGAVALECVSRSKPDLLLLDIMMPRVNGLSVARHLGREDDTRHIPIVFVTAMGSRYSVTAGISAGARSYVTKPFNVPKLVDKIESIIGQA
jgi:DNA-binding response OmpR family regulator